MNRTLRMTLTHTIAKTLLGILPNDVQMTVDKIGGIIGIKRQDCIPIFFMVCTARSSLSASQIKASDEYSSVGLVITVRTARNAEMFCGRHGYLEPLSETVFDRVRCVTAA